MENDVKDFDIAVLGCGLMGSALARALSASGHSVAAWNRSPAKAQALAASGITPFAELAEAVERSRLVLACTSTYETTRSALRQIDNWTGTTLINVGSGTPDQVESMAAWADERNVPYLDGAILCYPDQLGTPAGAVLFSGPAQTWHTHQNLLDSLGRALHVSSHVRGACIVDGAMTGGFYISSLAAYVEAATFALGQGLTAADLAAATQIFLDLLGNKTAEVAREIEAGQHETDQATISVFAAGARMCVATMQEAGHHARMIEAATRSLTAAEEAGLGDLGFSAQTRTAATVPQSPTQSNSSLFLTDSL